MIHPSQIRAHQEGSLFRLPASYAKRSLQHEQYFA